MGGSELVAQTACVVCQTPIDPPDKYCRHCGVRIGVAGGSVPPPNSVAPPPDTAPLAVAADPLVGAVVADRYRILQLLGRGGMGVVYKVEHAKIGKMMALKLLTGELARNRETVRRFKREALMASRLSHPNTVQVFDYGSSGGLTYLAMEYLSGQDLGAFVERQGPLPFARLCPLLQQVCGSLEEAHAQGIVHRDLKPENLFLTRTPAGDESIKVLDFGLAKLRESRELNEITSSGMIVGTPYFMPPEQVRGEDVDHRGDIYSLGCLAYTCLTGVHAFEANSPVAVLTLQITKIPEPPHLRFPGLRISPGVSAILGKALEKDPADRFQSVTEFEAALRAELLRTSQTTAAIPGSGYFPKTREEETATRDEVERYERNLKRKLRAGATLLTLGLAAGALLVARFVTNSQKGPVFDGREREPNQDVADALAVPWGETVRGRLGERLAKDQGDRDLYRFTLPDLPGPSGALTPRVSSLTLSSLPNLGVCAWLFRAGSENPLAQYCSGGPNQGISLPRLALTPGEYLVLVQQDRTKYEEAGAPLQVENVSDDYELSFELASDTSEARAGETEPNATRENANPLAAPGALRGALSFARDRDVVCFTGSGHAHFTVTDAPDGARPEHAVLQVTPLGGPTDKIPVRVHASSSSVKPTERDRKSPFTFDAGDLSEKPCVELELVPNPWAPTPHPLVAPPSEHEWLVSVEAK